MSRQSELAQLGRVFDSGPLSNRNLIINGAMQVAQRGTTFTPTASTSVYTLDRFQFYQNAGTVGVDQVTDSPDGFEYSLKCEVDTTGSVASTTILQIGQPIEGYNVTPLDWNGGSNAQPATASFWVKSSKAGVYGFRIRLGGVGTFIKEFTVNASNAWEYKTIAIPACPYTVPNKTNGMGIFIGIQLVSGSTYYVASDGVWQIADAYGTSGMDNDWITTSGATFYLTGVQLEVGDTATPFEHKSYGQELALCQRYFCKIQNNMGGVRYLGMLQAFTSSATYGVIADYPQVMRTVPSVAQGGSFGFFNAASSDAGATTAIGGFQPGNQSWLSGGWGGSSVLTAGHASVMYWADGAYLTADAEL